MIVTMPWPPSGLSPNARLHWAQKSALTKAYRRACWAAALQAGIKTDWDGPIHVWLDYYPPDRRHRDMDNVLAASKAALDGLADALGINDRRFRLHPNILDDIRGFVKISLTQNNVMP